MQSLVTFREMVTMVSPSLTRSASAATVHRVVAWAETKRRRMLTVNMATTTRGLARYLPMRLHTLRPNHTPRPVVRAVPDSPPAGGSARPVRIAVPSSSRVLRTAHLLPVFGGFMTLYSTFLSLKGRCGLFFEPTPAR
jgi:hypothetical protein